MWVISINNFETKNGLVYETILVSKKPLSKSNKKFRFTKCIVHYGIS